jgi:uncharacterized membrane protein YcaP (DUF421 family)
MNKADMKFGDWHRILFGESPPLYLLEVVVRVAVIYLLIQVAMRLFGKRMTAQVSRTERVARVSLAAAVGLTIQRPSRGILSSIVIITVIVLVGRWLAHLAFKSRKFEIAYQGYDATLVKDGVLNLGSMLKIRITKERLYAELRGKGIRHLGQVKRLYMEANGDFSIVENEKEIPGLAIIPGWDHEMCSRQQKTAELVCKNCGAKGSKSAGTCNHCNGTAFEPAILLPVPKEKKNR